VILCAGDEVVAEHVVLEDAPLAAADAVKTGGRTIMELERDVILSTLERLNGNRTHTAKALGITVRTVRNRLRKYRTTGEPPAASGPAVAF
jgi:two-component system response regulator FlrC